MMGTVAVVIVMVCAGMYTAAEIVERRKRRKFKEDLRRYIQTHKKEWSEEHDKELC